MRFATLPGLLLLALALAPVHAAEDGTPEAKEPRKGVQWTEDYAGALKSAKADGKRIFIEFTATW